MACTRGKHWFSVTTEIVILLKKFVRSNVLIRCSHVSTPCTKVQLPAEIFSALEIFYLKRVSFISCVECLFSFIFALSYLKWTKVTSILTQN